MFSSERRGSSNTDESCPYSANGGRMAPMLLLLLFPLLLLLLLASWDWIKGEEAVGGDELKVACIEAPLLPRKGKGEREEGTGNEGGREETIPREDVRGSGLEFVRLRLGDPTIGFCFKFFSTFL